MATLILNLDNLLSKLDDFADMDLTKPMEQACLLVENDAKRNCPVDTGQLRSSIRHEIEGVNKEAIVGVVGSNVEYAPYVEYGTGIYARDNNGRKTPWAYTDLKTGKTVWTHGSHPHPYLEPALLANKDNIRKIFREAIKEEAENV